MIVEFMFLLVAYTMYIMTVITERVTLRVGVAQMMVCEGVGMGLLD